MQETINKKPEFEFSESRLHRFVKTGISLLVYFLIYYFMFRNKPEWIIVITAIVLLHETGHFAAMKYFGYRDVQMFFIPFLGAFVSGSPQKISQRQRVITLFAGPTPGIIAGLIVLAIFLQTGARFYYQLSFFLITLNVFNLLPVTPLDGGQLLENLYGAKTRIVQPVFLMLTGLLLFAVAVKMGNPYILILVWFIITRIRRMLKVMSVRKALDREKVSYKTTYKMLDDQSYMVIRAALIRRVPALNGLDPETTGADEDRIVKWVQRVLDAPVSADLNRGQIIFSTLVWLILLVAPILLLFKFFSFRLFFV